MMRIIAVVRKNFRQLLHSQMSSLIIVIAPVILIVIAGIMLSGGGLQGIKVGMYIYEKNDLTQLMQEELAKKSFAVTYYGSLDMCKKSVIGGENHICVEIAKRDDLTASKIDPRLKNKVNFYVDYSRVRLVWAIISSVRSIVDRESARISGELTSRASEIVGRSFDEFNAQKENTRKVMNQMGALKSEVRKAQDSLIRIKSYIRESESLLNKVSDGSLIDTITYIEDGMDDLLSMAEVIYAGQGLSDEEFSDTWSSTKGYLDLLRNSLLDIRTDAQILEDKASTARIVVGEVDMRLDDFYWQIDSTRNELIRITNEINIMLKEFEWVKDVKPSDITNPIPVEIKPVATTVKSVGSVSNALTYLDYLLPSLTVIMIMFVATILSSMMIIKERKSPAYFRNMISPANKFVIIIGTYLTGLVLVALQIAILLGIAGIFFRASVMSAAHLVALILFFVISFFLLWGIIVGYLFNSEETAIVGSVSSALFFLVFSALIIPVETMPVWIGNITRISPFVVAETALRKILIFGAGLRSVYHSLLILVFYTVAAFVLAYTIQRVKKIKEI